MSQQGADVCLLDFAQESLNLIKSYPGSDKVKLVLADALDCPFKDNTFDIIFHQGLLEHFATPRVLLQENYRILKNDGLLLVDVPQTLHLYTIFKKILYFLNLWFAGWERQFTIRSLSTLLRRCGFEPLYFYGDWSRPGIIYKLIREILIRLNIRLPMFPRYLGRLTTRFYNSQNLLRQKQLFLYTVLSIGIIARKI